MSLLPSRDLDLRARGGLIFYEDTHSYFNAEGVKYTGMTTFLKKYVAGFDSDAMSKYKSLKEVLPKRNFDALKKKVGGWDKMYMYYDKVHGMVREDIKSSLEERRLGVLAEWANSTTEGSLEHDKREREVIENGVTWNGKYYPYEDKTILDITKDDCCVIPEIMVWDHNKKLCGLVDLPIFDKGVVHILDYKTNKKIEKSGFMGKKMKGPFKKHPDCNYGKYSAQLYGYQKMACDITGFEAGECWIISTESEKHKRKEDQYIECIDMSKEIELAFNLTKV